MTDYLKTHKFILNDYPHEFWWASLFYTGAFGVDSPEKLKEEYIKLGVDLPSESNDYPFKNQLYYHSSSIYGKLINRTNSPFSLIYNNLEGLKTFTES